MKVPISYSISPTHEVAVRIQSIVRETNMTRALLQERRFPGDLRPVRGSRSADRGVTSNRA